MEKNPNKRHCKECGKYRWRASWGLCQPCYLTPDIRRKYALLGVEDSTKRPEETMEQLEAMIAERSKPENLPAWWWKDWEREGMVGNS